MLRIGELARHAGLTVRTLHHYDAIGLLKPSARSEGGYRLYTQAEIARLHGIQALRHLGLSLDEIRGLLDEGGRAALPVIVEQQIRSLDRQIEQATQLRRLLALLQDKFAAGEQPDAGDWLATLRSMTTCDKYFSPDELKLIFGNWSRVADDFAALMADICRSMEQGIAADSLEVQPLAHRWMMLMSTWLGGDLDLMQRWGEMYKREHATHNSSGPSLAMVRYIEGPIDQRLQALRRHLTWEELRRLKPVPQHEWAALEAAVRNAMQHAVAPASEAGHTLHLCRMEMFDRVVDHDEVLRAKLLAAYAAEPVLAAGTPLPADVRAYLQAAAHQWLDPLVA